MRRATCCASPTGAASRTWRCGPARDASCTRPCRAAASSRTTCSPTRRRCGGCGSFSSRCAGWKRPIGETAPLGSHPEGWAIFERMKLVLFDIDGTLLWTDGAGRRAIHRALLDETGTAGPIETYRFDGKTDPQIVRELLALAGHPAAEDVGRIDAVCRRYVEHLRSELASPAQTTKLMPGTRELLAALEPHEVGQRALVGLLTGNVAPGAALKLRSAGLDPARFRVGAYGSDSARRADLPAVAARRAAEVTHCRFAGADVIVIGDTPDDVACGRPIGARSVAVATGSYDVAALRAAGAAYVFATLADTAAVLDAIFA